MEPKSSRLHIGLNTDVLPKNRQNGYYGYALNAVLESREGDHSAIVNELGNDRALSTPGFVVIGHALTDTDDIILFSVNESTNVSQIGTWNPVSGNYKTEILSSCLNFSTKHPVDSLFRVRKGCERIIYFTDRNNPYRTINLNSLLDYTDSPSVDVANQSDNWDCNQFRINPDVQLPLVDLDEVLNTGGRLDVGTYQFAIQYLDEDLNPTNWFYITRPVPIVNEPYTADYSQIHGGIPIFDNAEAEEGAVPKTSKAIRLRITNLDQTYAYYRVAALHSTSTIGNVSETWITREVPINNDTSIYTYRGPDLNSDFEGSLADIQIDRPVIDVVQDHAQADQALWLAGFKNKKYPWAKFQRAASKIKVACVPKRVEVTNINNEGDPKNPHTTFDTRGFTPDEVYAFGIRYLFRDGTWSPTFHIPGRPLNFDPFYNLAVSDDELLSSAYTDHLEVDSEVKWKVKSSAKLYEQDSSDPTDLGKWLMGYHEAEDANATYPDIRDCDDNLIWGEDVQSNPITTTTKIRHHRFPSRRDIPTHDADDTSDWISILGAEFSNIEYPHEDIVGHQIMMSERKDQDKTVLDSGLVRAGFSSETTISDIELVPSSAFFGSFVDSGVFVSPKTLMTLDYLSGTYLQFTGYYEPVITPGGELSVDIDGGSDWTIENYQVHALGNASYNNIFSPINVGLVSQFYLAPSSSENNIGVINTTVVNRSFSNSAYVFTMNNDYDLPDPALYITATMKQNVDPYTAIQRLVYVPIENSYTLAEENTLTYSGDNYTSPINIVDIWSVRNTSRNVRFGYYSGVWVDSELNFSLRHPGTSDCNQIYESGSQAEYVKNKVFEPSPDDDNKYILRQEVCPEYYGYNLDYSKINIEKPGFTLGPSFDYCSNCLEEYPYRIRVSKRSYQEDQADNYRQFLANDYLDLQGAGGPIKSLVVDKDELYAISERNTWFVPTRPQTIQTNETLTYLGTGERLSIPAKRLATPDHSYGGTLNSWSVSSTEFGTVYVDAPSGKVFHLADGIDEISNKGMRNWFRENLPFNINRQFQDTMGYDFPLSDNPTYNNGAGILTIYDPRHRRVIIHKRDFKVTDEYWGGELPAYPEPEMIYWNPDEERFEYYSSWSGNAALPAVPEQSTSAFENKSWTISYSFPHQHWTSFHSYLPSYGFNDHRTFYTNSFGFDLYEHNKGNYQRFYSENYPHIIDFTTAFNPVISSTTTGMSLASNFERYSLEDNQFVTLGDEFFNYGVVYNSIQSTGQQTISIKDTFDTVDDTPDNILATQADRTWRMNNFRNYVTDYTEPLWTEDWGKLSASFPIDKVPNADAFDYGKSLFESERLRDYWVGTRLEYRPERAQEVPKITTDLVLTQSQISYR